MRDARRVSGLVRRGVLAVIYRRTTSAPDAAGRKFPVWLVRRHRLGYWLHRRWGHEALRRQLVNEAGRGR